MAGPGNRGDSDSSPQPQLLVVKQDADAAPSSAVPTRRSGQESLLPLVADARHQPDPLTLSSLKRQRAPGDEQTISEQSPGSSTAERDAEPVSPSKRARHLVSRLHVHLDLGPDHCSYDSLTPGSHGDAATDMASPRHLRRAIEAIAVSDNTSLVGSSPRSHVERSSVDSSDHDPATEPVTPPRARAIPIPVPRRADNDAEMQPAASSLDSGITCSPSMSPRKRGRLHLDDHAHDLDAPMTPSKAGSVDGVPAGRNHRSLEEKERRNQQAQASRLRRKKREIALYEENRKLKASVSKMQQQIQTLHLQAQERSNKLCSLTNDNAVLRARCHELELGAHSHAAAVLAASPPPMDGEPGTPKRMQSGGASPVRGYSLVGGPPSPTGAPVTPPGRAPQPRRGMYQSLEHQQHHHHHAQRQAAMYHQQQQQQHQYRYSLPPLYPDAGSSVYPHQSQQPSLASGYPSLHNAPLQPSLPASHLQQPQSPYPPMHPQQHQHQQQQHQPSSPLHSPTYPSLDPRAGSSFMHGNPNAEPIDEYAPYRDQSMYRL